MSTVSQRKGYFLVKGSSQQLAINYVITGLGLSPFLFWYAKNGNNRLKRGTKAAVPEDGARRSLDIPMATASFPSPTCRTLGSEWSVLPNACFVRGIKVEQSFGSDN